MDAIEKSGRLGKKNGKGFYTYTPDGKRGEVDATIYSTLGLGQPTNPHSTAECIERGVFSTRSPRRPNAIGLSILELVRREGNVLHLDGVDILDGTPLLDIKPFTAKFDGIITPTRNGWQDEVDEATAQKRGKRGFRGGNPA